MAELERLGETGEFGWCLLRLLGLSGWSIVVTTPFAGAPVDEQDASSEAEHAGVLVIAARGGHEIRMTGESVAAIACDLFQEAVRRQRLSIGHDVQMTLA